VEKKDKETKNEIRIMEGTIIREKDKSQTEVERAIMKKEDIMGV